MSFDINDIIALSAILAPSLTAIITGYFQRKTQREDIKQRKLETVYLHKREVLENYIHSLEECNIHSEDYRLKNEYYKHYGFAVLNVSKSVRKKMDIVNGYIQQNKFDKVNKELPELISAIADEINEFLK